MARSLRSERREVKALGASVPLYRHARRSGATHEEVRSVLRDGAPAFWRYELFRSAGASHAEALALDAAGIDALSYRDLRRIGVSDAEVRRAKEHGVPLDVYFSARHAGLADADAICIIDAGFRHAATARAWRTAVRARELLAGREQATQANLALVVRRAEGCKGGADALVREIARERPAEAAAA